MTVNYPPLTQNRHRSCSVSEHIGHKSTILKLLAICLALVQISQAQSIFKQTRSNLSPSTPFLEEHPANKQTTLKLAKTKSGRIVAKEKRALSERRFLNGEESCENNGYNEDECNDIGCCHYDDDECWSAVGNGACGDEEEEEEEEDEYLIIEVDK